MCYLGDVMIDLENFDFDEWLQLASEDQSAFETRRSEYIQEFINQIPGQMREKLRKIQWRLDMERKLSDSPMTSCQNIYNQMWNSVYGKNGLSERLNQLVMCWENPELANATVLVEEPCQQAENVIYTNRFQKDYAGE